MEILTECDYRDLITRAMNNILQASYEITDKYDAKENKKLIDKLIECKYILDECMNMEIKK